MFDGNHIDAFGFIEVLVFVDEEQVALFEGDGLLVATQVLIITPTNIFANIFIHTSQSRSSLIVKTFRDPAVDTPWPQAAPTDCHQTSKKEDSVYHNNLHCFPA